MTAEDVEDVEDVRRWSRDECACNHVLNRQGRLSGSELAVNHVIALLAEVERLRAVISRQIEVCHACDGVEHCDFCSPLREAVK